MPHAGVQGAAHRQPARRLLSRPRVPGLRDGARDLPPALLDEHDVQLAARPAVPHARPQRRDQYPVGQPQRDAGSRAGARRAALGRRSGPPQARHLVGGKRLGQSRQRARAAGAVGARPGACPHDARPRGPRGCRGDGARPAGLLRVPRMPGGAVGRAGRAGLLGRRVRGLGTRPQRPAAMPLQDHPRRTGGGGVRVGPRGPEPGRRGGERPARARRAAGGGHRPANDPPTPPLARIPPGLYAYLRQRFAQVTNPAIDPLRETLVMSLRMHIGRRGSLLADRPAGLRLVRNEHPVLLAEEIAALRSGAGVQVVTLDTTWSASAGGGPDALRTALDGLCRSAGHAVQEGARIVILSDRAAGYERAPLPMVLAVGAVHQHLLEHGLRTRLGLIAEAGDAWDVHHFAALIGYGAEAVHPWLALESVQAPVAEDDARGPFRAPAQAGLLHTPSQNGISTLSSYCGAQIFEALGLGAEVVDRCFTGTVSTIGGIGFAEIAEDIVARQRAAYPSEPEATEPPPLPDHGRVRYRRGGADPRGAPPLLRPTQGAVTPGAAPAHGAVPA